MRFEAIIKNVIQILRESSLQQSLAFSNNFNEVKRSLTFHKYVTALFHTLWTLNISLYGLTMTMQYGNSKTLLTLC